MATVINTNVMSMFSQTALTRSKSSMATSLERLSTGLRINRASDDAAGLAVSQKMELQIRGMQQAVRNVNDGIAFMQAGESALGEIQNMLQRMNELAVQQASATYSSSDKTKISTELTALKTEINRQVGLIKVNGVNLNTTSGIAIAVDENGGTLTVGNLSAAVVQPTGVTVSAIATSMEAVSVARAKFGADINTLAGTARNLEAKIVGLSSAKSSILDADFAMETSNLTKTQILQQAGTAMLAQANALPQNALSLLR